MNTSTFPPAKYVDGVLRIDFGESGNPTTRREIDVAIDVDEFGTPTGVELLGLRHWLGDGAAEQFEELSRRDKALVGYDREADAASIGTGIATGSRIAGSSPERAVVSLDANGRVLSIDVIDLDGRT